MIPMTSHVLHARVPWILSRVTSCLYYMYSTHSFCIISYLLIIGGIETNPGPLHRGNISIVHNNVSSLPPKMDIFDSELSKHDVICFSETHLNASIDNGQIQLSGFQGQFRGRGRRIC